MKHTSFKIVRYLAFSLLVVLGIGLISGVVTLGGLFSFLGLSGTATLAALPTGAAYAQEGSGVTTVGNETTGALKDFLDNDISQEITKMRPASTPLDTILRKTGKIIPVKSWETEWYTSDVRGVQDRVKTAISATTATTPTAFTMYVDAPYIWSVDDNILVAATKTNGDASNVTGYGGNLLVVHVVDKDASAGWLKVIPVNPLTEYDLPAIPQYTLLTRIGNSKSETDAQTSPYATFPAKSSNYCQIHMAQVEESVYMNLHKRDGDIKWDLMEYQMQSLYDLRRSMELTSLFGVKGKHYDPVGGDWKYFSDGLYNLAAGANTLEYLWDISEASHNIDNDLFLSWTKTLFTGNSGSDTRFLFAGSDLIQYLGGVPNIQKQIEAKNVEVVYGIKFNRIETPFGVLLIKHHSLLDYAYHQKDGIILDMNNVEKHILKPMDSRELEFIKTGQKNSNAYVVDEAFCLVLRYPDTHAIVKYTSQA
jgi:hypothetical protein